MINITRNLYDQRILANIDPVDENLTIILAALIVFTHISVGIGRLLVLRLVLEVSVEDDMVPVCLCSIFIHDSVNHLAVLWVIPLYQDAVNLIV